MKKQSPDINRFHQEQLVHIGRILQAARESQGLTCEALAEKTLIRPSLLLAMEAANITQLPEPVYTRGLIRRYGDSLGLDGEALALQYFTPPSKHPAKQSFWRVPLTPQLRPVHLYVTYVVLIAIAISALSYTLQRMSYRTSTLPVLEGDAAEEAMLPEEGLASEESAAENEAGRTSLPPEIASEPVRVSVKLQAQSWLRVTADGKVTFEGILKEGDAQIWTAEKELILRAGNAGGVMVSFNEGSAAVLGQPGMVAEATFPPKDTAQLQAP